MTNPRRRRQIGELVHEELSTLIQYRTQDPRLGFMTVTGVDMSADLKHAQVYVTVFDEAEVKDTFEGLNSARGFFKRELGRVLKLRFVPDLTFKLDKSLEYGSRIEQLLDEIPPPRNLDDSPTEDES